MMGPADVVLACSAVSIAIVAYGGSRFPERIAGSARTSFVSALAALAVYAGAALWTRSRSSSAVQLALRVGTTIGITIGCISSLNHVVELWVPLPGSLGTVFGAGMWALMFLAFGIACSVTLPRGGSAIAGVVASVWCGMVMTIVLVVVALMLGMAFMPHMERVLAGAFATSGMSDLRAFVTRHQAESASTHLVLAPAVAALVGVLTLLSFTVAAALDRRLAIPLLGAALLLLVGGIASIAHASSLERSHRPPFIMLGLAALATSLVSLHPLLLATRRPARIALTSA